MVGISLTLEKHLKEAGLLDDIRDLRRYLLLCEQEILAQSDPETIEEMFSTTIIQESQHDDNS